MMRRRNEDEREHGQILVLFALVLVVILAFAAIAVDLGVLRNNRQILRNTTDAAALAGSNRLPVTGSTAAEAVTTLVNSTIQTNYPGLPQSGTDIGKRCVKVAPSLTSVDLALGSCAYTIEYRCLIGADSTGPLISRDIPRVCDPASHQDFTGAGGTRSSPCDPYLGDKCNVVVVTGSSTTEYAFAPVVGISNGSSGAVSSAACGGPCGAAPLPLNDVELVIDTSGSMQTNKDGTAKTRIAWAKEAAIQLLTDLVNNGGIGLQSDGSTGNRMGITTFRGTPHSSTAGVSNPALWSVSVRPNPDGSLPSNSIEAYINSLSASGNTPTKEGMAAAQADLSTNARPKGPSVKRVLIFVSDGRPNPDLGPNNKPADGGACGPLVAPTPPAPTPTAPPIPPTTTDVPGNERPTQIQINDYLGLADTAYSIMIGDPTAKLACGATSRSTLNSNILDPALMNFLAKPDDTDHWFNPTTPDLLKRIFSQIASQILGPGAHLIQLYPAPVVTGVAGVTDRSAPKTTITISGTNLNGATSVTVGGTPYTVTANSDSSISAESSTTPPAPGTPVDVQVTTPGGSSPIVRPNDQYTYP